MTCGPTPPPTAFRNASAKRHTNCTRCILRYLTSKAGYGFPAQCTDRSEHITNQIRNGSTMLNELIDGLPNPIPQTEPPEPRKMPENTRHVRFLGSCALAILMRPPLHWRSICSICPAAMATSTHGISSSCSWRFTKSSQRSELRAARTWTRREMEEMEAGRAQRD